jgi:polar amino acid transport system permease protein
MPTDFLSYVVSPFLLWGALLAIEISVLAMAFGLVLGLGLALMRLSRHAALRGPAWCYIWFVRGTPLLLQLVFIYDVLPVIGIKLDTFTTAVIGFSLNEAAFGAEIIRGGVLSVSRNQPIAAAALGMPPLMTLRRIVLPQAMRAILPGIANQAISMIKGTSIASVIFVNELTFRAEQIVGQNFRFFTVFSAAGMIYLAWRSARLPPSGVSTSSASAATQASDGWPRSGGGAARCRLLRRRLNCGRRRHNPSGCLP